MPRVDLLLQRSSVLLASRLGVALCLALVVAWGAVLRLSGSDWDQGQHLHPDERFLTMVETAMVWPTENLVGTYFDEAKSTLNPRNVGHTFFVYGDLPIIAVKVVATLLDQGGYEQVYLVGRAMVAIVDLGTLLLVFSIGRQVYRDVRIALLGALLYASAGLAIQQAHFFVVDNFSTFFATLALYCCARLMERGQLRFYLLAGGCAGLAVASKLSVYSIVGVIIAVAGYRLYRDWTDPRVDRRVAVERVALRLILAGAATCLAFRIAQPYAFQGPSILDIGFAPRWVANITEAREWVSGVRDAPFTHQWTDRAWLLFPLRNLVQWGLGVPLGLTAVIGWGVAAYQLARRRRWAHLVPVLWVALLFGLLGTQWAPSMRYFLPIYPMLALLGAWLLVALWDAARVGPVLVLARQVRWTWTPALAGAVLQLVVGGTALYGLAVAEIHTREHTRVAASRWIYEHIPPGTVVANETSWDDTLPRVVDNQDGLGSLYLGLMLNLPDADTPDKLALVLDVLDRSEYLFISSNRQSDSLTRLPERFPMVTAYYQTLFDGRLGFERVAEFTSYPQIFGIELPDQGAEEAWSVYDHPRVQIFRKTDRYNHANAQALLGGVDWANAVPMSALQATETRHGMLLSPEERLQARADGTFSELFPPDGIGTRAPVAVWVLALLLLGIVALPYLWLVAAPLPDRGLAFARPLGLLAVAWVSWWLASLNLVPFALAGIALSIASVAAGAALIVVLHRRALLGWLRQHRGLLLLQEGLFWGFFAAMLLVRWQNPDLWHPSLGGEKPMDFAYLNATVKSTTFPPYDPWFAGGYVNYYYYGFVLVATLVKLTAVPPQIAYNLAIPTFFAALALAAFGASLALVSAGARRGGGTRGALGLALIGTLFVAVCGNLRQVTLLLEGFYALGGADQSGASGPLAPLARTVSGFVANVFGGQPLPFRIEWWYWNASRVIQHPPEESGPINEFPLFTFLFADLHAHLLALPYAALVVGLALIPIWRNGASESRLLGGARALLIALVLGALWVVNTWDFPTYALVVLAAMLLASLRSGARSTPRALLGAAARWGLILALSYACFLPYHWYYAAPDLGISRWAGSRTSLSDYLTIHGFFLFAICGALIADLLVSPDLNPVARLVRFVLRHPFGVPRLRRRLRPLSLAVRRGFGLLGLAALLCAALGAIGESVMAVIVALMALSALLLVRPAGRRGPASDRAQPLWQMALALILIGLALTLFAELFVPTGLDIGRMNTVFKLYLQVWVLWGLAAAAAVAFVFARQGRLQPEWRAAWRYELALLLLATLLYPLTAIPARVADRFDPAVGPTLDGMAFMTSAIVIDRDQKLPLVYDLQAIRWIQDTLPGSPVIAEVNTAPLLYGWGSRISVFTGNPTVIGWDWHQKQQRGVLPFPLVESRVQAVQRAYGTTDPLEAYRIFAGYQVHYFVVGPLERLYFPDGQAKWTRGDGKLWSLVYQNPAYQIYRIAPAPAVGASPST